MDGGSGEKKGIWLTLRHSDGADRIQEDGCRNNGEYKYWESMMWFTQQLLLR